MAVEPIRTDDPCAQLIRAFCVVCSCAFEYERKHQGRRRIACSDSCRKARQAALKCDSHVPARYPATCEACGKNFDSKKGGERKARYCSSRCRLRGYRPKQSERSCAACGALFLGSGQAKYCSRACVGVGVGDALRRTDRPRITCGTCGNDFEQRKRGLDKNLFCSRVCAFKRPRPEQPKPPPTHCKQCGITNPPRRRVFCCDACKRKHDRRARPYVSQVKVTQRACEHCNVMFASTHGNRMCSKECKRKSLRWTKDHYRRARKYGCHRERFDPRQVFERDHYRCQLCGKATKQTNKQGYNPLGPSLDHIIPLSKGGPHTMANTQCAHHICNSHKSAGKRTALKLIMQ